MKNKFDYWLNNLNDLFAISSFFAMCIIVIMSVLLRYFFSFSFRWVDELTRYLFIYMVFLGIPIAFREKAHVKIEYFASFFSKRLKVLALMFSDLLILITMLYIGNSTLYMINSRLGKTLSPGLKLPMKYVYFAVIISFVLLTIEIIRRFISKHKEE
jgi:TRAP-type C4-dicarboxylate transport system permease small subunit